MTPVYPIRFRLKYLILLFTCCLFSLQYSFAQTPDANGILYVKKGGTGNQSGVSWLHAIAELGNAIEYARTLNGTAAGTVKEIWVAAGTYNPMYLIGGTNTNLRFKAFKLLPDVNIRGQFAGTESSAASRDFTNTANKTTLSGNLGGSVYAFHVVFGYSDLGTAELDGFTITEGIANTSDFTQINSTNILGSWGGGIFLTNNASASLKNLVITDNYANDYGGGILAMYSSNITLNNVIVKSNTCNLYGGGIAAFNAQINLTDVTITNNEANTGAGIFVNATSPLILNRVSIQSNNATGQGGGIFAQTGCPVTANNIRVQGNSTAGNGGGIYLQQSNSSSSFTNSLITGNSAVSLGGGIYSVSETVSVVNSVVAANTAASGGAIYSNNNSSLQVKNSVISNNNSGVTIDGFSTSSFSYSLVQGMAADPALHLLDGSLDPMFTSPISHYDAPIAGGTYTTQSTSPLINAGSNANFIGLDATTKDLAGNNRVTNFSTGGNIDIGAYENTSTIAQTIGNAADISKTYGAVVFEPGATISSGLPLTYTSNNTAVADVYQDAADGNKWKIKVTGAGLATITISQPGNSSYDAASKSILLTVARATLLVKAKDKTKDYDGVAYSGGEGVSYTGFVNNEDVSVLSGTLAWSGSSQGAVNANVYIITTGGLAADNYSIIYMPGALTIKKVNLQVAADAQTKTYGATDPGFTFEATGLQGTDDESIFSGALSRAAGETVGNYGINVGNLSAGPNYNMTFTGNTLNITKATLNITAEPKTKVFGDTDPALTYSVSGLQLTDNNSVITGSLTRNPGENAGDYSILKGNLDAGGNYDISYTGNSLTISKIAQTISLTTQTDGATINKIYGDGTVDGAATVSSGLTLSYASNNTNVATVSATGLVQIVGAGSATITVSQAGGTNYEAATSKSFTLAVSAAPLTITAKGHSKNYDGNAYTGGSGIDITGFVNSENVSSLSGNLTYGGTAQNAKNAGTYTIIPGGYTSSNYSITYSNGTLTIAKVGLFINANAQTKTYGAADPTLTWSATGYAGADDASVITGTLYRVPGENVGAYTITPGSISAGVNYAVNFIGNSLNITKASLSIVVDAKTKVYGASDPALTYTPAGFVNGDNNSVIIGSIARDAGEDAGDYAIRQNTLTAGTNYTIAFTGSNLTITKATLEITAEPKTKVFGSADPALTYSVNGFQFTDGNSIIMGSLTRNPGENAGSYAILKGNLNAGSNYDIAYTGNSLTIGKASQTITLTTQTNGATVNKTYGDGTVDGAATVNSSLTLSYSSNNTSVVTVSNTGQVQIVGAGNATITISQAGGTNYDAATSKSFTLAVSPAALSITARNHTKTYDATAYTGGNDVDFSGFVNNENVSNLAGSLSYSGTAQNAKNVGSYTITPGGYTSTNYSITFVDGSLTISKASLNINANAQTKIYGSVDPSLTWSATGYAGNENASVITGSLLRAAGENVGAYAIGAGTIDAGTNYIVHFTGNDLNITKASLSIVVDPKTKVYGSSDPALTYTPAGFVNGDNNSVIIGSIARDGGENAGDYAIKQNTLSAGNNYTISFTGNTFTITKASQAITWVQDLTVGCSGASTVALTATSNSGLPVSYIVTNNNIASVNGSILNLANAGSTTITATQAGDANHTAATAVTNTLKYMSPALVRQHWSDVLIFDNTSNNYVQWQWYKNNNSVPGSNSAWFKESGALNGTYYVEATDKNGNTVSSCPLTLTGTNTASRGLKVTPNPASAGSQVTITCNFSNTDLQGSQLVVSSVTGTVLQQITSVQPVNTVTMPPQTGIYIVTLRLANGQKISTNVLVK